MEPESATPLPKPGSGVNAAAWLIVLCLSFVLLHNGKDLFVPLVIAFIGVYLMKILSHWIGRVRLGKHHLPRPLPVILAVLVVIALSLLLFQIIADNALKVAEYAPRYQTRLQELQAGIFAQFGVEQPPALRQFLANANLTAVLTGVATNLAGLLKTATLIVIFAVFLILEARFFRVKIQALFPDPARYQRVQEMLGRIDEDIQTYFGVKTLVSFLTAVMSYVVMRLTGLHFAEFWALLVFILNFIPTIGSIVATVLPSLLALLQFESLTPFLVLFVGITVIQQFMGNFLEPNLMGITLNISPLVVVMSLILWGMLWGIVGMFLCVPITAVALIILANFPETRWVAVLLSKGGTVRI